MSSSATFAAVLQRTPLWRLVFFTGMFAELRFRLVPFFGLPETMLPHAMSWSRTELRLSTGSAKTESTGSPSSNRLELELLSFALSETVEDVDGGDPSSSVNSVGLEFFWVASISSVETPLEQREREVLELV